MKDNASDDGSRATLIGDIVGSRLATDRAALHQQLTAALGEVAATAIDPPAFTVGDEFQGSYPTVGEALDSALRLRLALAPVIDVRFGIGWGEVTVLDARAGIQEGDLGIDRQADLAQDATAGIQDGPGWWAAREAIEWTASAQRQSGLALVRTAFRSNSQTGPSADAVNAALICRDHLLGSLDERSLRILKGLMGDRTKKELAADEGISASAVSQRAGRDGLDLLVLASHYLRSVR